MWHECECEGDCPQKSISECTKHQSLKQMGYRRREPDQLPLCSALLNGKLRLQFTSIGKIWLVWEVSISDATFGNGIKVQINPAPRWPHLYAWDVLEQEICITDLQPTNLQQQQEAIVSIASHNWTKTSEECFQHLHESVPRITLSSEKKGVWY